MRGKIVARNWGFGAFAQWIYLFLLINQLVVFPQIWILLQFPYEPPTHTHTHLLRTVFANFDVECILRAKNTPIKPDRKGSMTRSEKDRNVTYPSEPNRSPSIDSWEIQIAKTVQALRWHGKKTERLGLVLTEKGIGKVVLGLATSHHGNKNWCRYVQLAKLDIPFHW